jgi:phytoene desaturase
VKLTKASKVVIIGGGFGGLAAAALLSCAGLSVQLLERNETLGGRARVWTENGFRFDMGPSWYLMPDVFDHFFKLCNQDVDTVLPTKRLSPSYRVYLAGSDAPVDMYSDTVRDGATLDRFFPGSSKSLDAYIKTSKSHYDRSLRSFMARNADTFFHYMTLATMRDGWGLPVLISMEKHLSKWFKNDTVRRFLAYQTLFLGNAPKETPGVFSAMNYVDFAMGVHYPDGGIGAIVTAMANIITKTGGTITTGADVSSINIEICSARSVTLTDGRVIDADIVVANSDYHHVESVLLPKESQSLDQNYWSKKRPAPSAAILYLGIRGDAPMLEHHTLLFPDDWDLSFSELFHGHSLPTDPSIYVSCPSKTDPTVAPSGHTNLFILMPCPTGLTWTPDLKRECTERLLDILEQSFSIDGVRDRVVVQRFYCGEDFSNDYCAWLGNALGGQAHTLSQSSFMRPPARSRKVRNLFFVGAGTNPGIGMPMCLLSAEMLVKRLFKTGGPGLLKQLPRI